MVSGGHSFRPVHAWNYRRYLLSKMEDATSQKVEVVYTTRKIKTDFSNFGAWHHRSKLLPLLWEEGKLDERTSREAGEQLKARLVAGCPDILTYDRA